MTSTQTLSSEQQQIVEAAVAQMSEDQAKISKAMADYHNSMVSASTSVGPDGGNLQGWITYTHGGEKIHFQLEGRPTTFHGLFAGVAAVALIGALPARTLAGKVGTFKVSGGLTGGQLFMRLDGKPVFTGPIHFAGVGGFGWGLEGKVRFSEAQ